MSPNLLLERVLQKISVKDLLAQVPPKVVKVLSHQEGRNDHQANRLVRLVVGVTNDRDYLLLFALQE